MGTHLVGGPAPHETGLGMCGIAALIERPPADLQDLIDAMTDRLEHRGPDDRGTVVSNDDGVALGARRLSILDPQGGHQPMHDETGRYHVVFNGEIYNCAELRQELVARGHRFATDHSDTEVLVHGFAEWNAQLFARLNGMFALAIWDRAGHRLVLARDRMGKKPLYVTRTTRGYAAASELKALLCHPGIRDEVDPVALEQYLAFDFVIGPRTILAQVDKLPAGHYASVTADSFEANPYWSLRVGVQDAPAGPEERIVARFDQLLDAAVARRMIADVPIGLFLSGGLDSTTIGHFMRRHSSTVESFSIGFEDAAYDESVYSARAAQALGTVHHREVLSAARLYELVPHVAEVLDEPMADPSILPTYLLSTFARGDVKVALSGDGSDELLMGYDLYRPLKLLWTLDRLPLAVRRAVAGAARRRTTTASAPAVALGVELARWCDRTPTDRLLGLLGSFRGRARWVLSADIRNALTHAGPEATASELLDGAAPMLDGAGQTVAAYVRAYLQEDILVKVDRASMAASLEVRAPFLDAALVEFLLSLPTPLKLRGFTGKYLLRRLMRGRIPAELVDRPKMGFAVPLDSWMRGALAPLVREYLDPVRLARAGYFDPVAVAGIVSNHVEGTRNRGRELWALLQFELWRERWCA